MKKNILDKLQNHNYEFNEDEIVSLLNSNEDDKKVLRKYANEKKKHYFGNRVKVRGVIEISNICVNNCKYCSMSRSNLKLHRYVIEMEHFKRAVDTGLNMGVKIFHISSGENNVVSDDALLEMTEYIVKANADVILVLGEKNDDLLRQLYSNGAHTYIAKFETSNPWLYFEYNDKNSNLDGRIEFLNRLKKIGYNIGTGNIVGLPFQNDFILAKDLKLLKKINPMHASTSRFISNCNAEYGKYKSGNIEKTLNYIAVMRLLLEDKVIIPTNSSIGETGKYQALRMGANLLSINLTPDNIYMDYDIYNWETRKKINIMEYKDKLEKMDLEIEF